MPDILDLIRYRRSLRVAFDPERLVSKEDLGRVLEAARWTPTSHEHAELRDRGGRRRGRPRSSRPCGAPDLRGVHPRELRATLLFKRRTAPAQDGLLASMFPPAWQTPDFKADALEQSGIFSRQRALPPQPGHACGGVRPEQEGAGLQKATFWASSAWAALWRTSGWRRKHWGWACRSVSSLAGTAELKEILGIPDDRRVAFSCRLGYPVEEPAEYPRVRREVEDLHPLQPLREALGPAAGPHGASAGFCAR